VPNRIFEGAVYLKRGVRNRTLPPLSDIYDMKTLAAFDASENIVCADLNNMMCTVVGAMDDDR